MLNMKYLAVDSDQDLAYSEAEVWQSTRGIGMDRVDTMTEAIQMLMSHNYLYVGINGDVTDFLPLLGTMRSVTNTPILIATNNFTTEMEVAALDSGADLFASYHKCSAGNVASVLAHIAKIIERSHMPCPATDVLVYRDILIAPTSKQVFVNDKPVLIVKLERAVLCCLIRNKGRVVPALEILSEVWGKDYENQTELLWRTMNRLRSKLLAASPGSEYIKVEREEGYTMI